MKPARTYYIFIVLLILLFGCKDKRIKFKDFQNQFQLKGNTVEMPIFFKNGLLEIYDSLIIISITDGNLKCIHLFDKKNFKYIASSGIRGKGPSEINVPALATIDKNNGIIWYRDLGKQKIWKFPINDIISNPNFLPSISIPLPEVEVFGEFHYFENNSFSFSNLFNNSLISFFDSTGRIDVNKSIPDKLKIINLVNEKKKFSFQTTNYHFTSNPDRIKFVIAYRYSDIVELVDKNGTVIWITQGPDNISQTPDYDNKFLIQANTYVTCDSKYIYCLYSGRKEYDEKDGELKHNYAKELHIYNWEGNPITKLLLNYTAVRFDFDVENNRLVTLSPETGGIVYYDLPKFN